MRDTQERSVDKGSILSDALKFFGTVIAIVSAMLISTGWFTFEALFGLMDLRADNGALSLYQLMMAGAHGGALALIIVVAAILTTILVATLAQIIAPDVTDWLIAKFQSVKSWKVERLSALLAASFVLLLFLLSNAMLGNYVASTIFEAAEKKFEAHCRRPDGDCPSYIVKMGDIERGLRAIPIFSDGNNIYFMAADRIEVLPRGSVTPLRANFRAKKAQS